MVDGLAVIRSVPPRGTYEKWFETQSPTTLEREAKQGKLLDIP